jgi:hypothetical protein
MAGGAMHPPWEGWRWLAVGAGFAFASADVFLVFNGNGSPFMRRVLLLSAVLPLLWMGAPAHAQDAATNDADYLQNRAATLNDRIDIAANEHKLSKKKAKSLHLTVGRVQTQAGNLQTRNGTIAPSDVDRMNQTLTDVERALSR